MRVNAFFSTRRAFRFDLPATGDTFSVTTYAPLYDNQPRNCPVDTQPMLYKIRASSVKLKLAGVNADIPDADYSVPGVAVWKGAVSTPTGGQ